MRLDTEIINGTVIAAGEGRAPVFRSGNPALIGGSAARTGPRDTPLTAPEFS
ncbi:hypothetical protein ACFV4K_16020 [Nocardia sp. NPDC059764]|uniref:hypothetical protein n=1 Tax=Nocardia sp. NPDC059764 TaxID=3346939 RepID=UPI003663E079